VLTFARPYPPSFLISSGSRTPAVQQ
jgi:hypothetical protein